MDELEKLQRAQSYMKMLADGVDPVSGVSVEEDSVVNNIRLSRCFFYVAEVLQKVIDNGGEVNRKRSVPKALFSITPEQIETIPTEDAGIPVTAIVGRINESALTDESEKGLSSTPVTNWLVGTGLLEIVFGKDGKSRKVPTEAGETMGIYTESRTGQYGMYTIVLYNREAQRFLLDNLEAILEEYREEKMTKTSKAVNQGQPWTPEQDIALCKAFDEGASLPELCEQFGRSRSSIRGRLVKYEKL